MKINYSYIFILALAIFAFNMFNCHGQTIIQEQNITLSEICDNNIYKTNDHFILLNNSQDKFIKSKRRYWHDSSLSEENVEGVCIQAFVKWCNKFVGENRKYFIFRTSWHPKFEDMDLCPWTIDSTKYNTFHVGNSEIMIDPFYDNLELNNYMRENQVIISISCKRTIGFLEVVLDAVVPFYNNYYKFTTRYFFCYQINFSQFKTKNILSIRKKLARIFVSDNLQETHDISGFSGAAMFYLKYFIWTYKSMDDTHIIRINVNPNNEKITLKRLFS